VGKSVICCGDSGLRWGLVVGSAGSGVHEEVCNKVGELGAGVGGS